MWHNESAAPAREKALSQLATEPPSLRFRSFVWHHFLLFFSAHHTPQHQPVAVAVAVMATTRLDAVTTHSSYAAAAFPVSTKTRRRRRFKEGKRKEDLSFLPSFHAFFLPQRFPPYQIIRAAFLFFSWLMFLVHYYH